MSTSTNFLSDANVQMLWEVLIDEESVIKDRRTQETFVKILPQFYDKEKSKNNTLIGLNKQFISLMMNLLVTPVSVAPKKVLITQEDLHNERASQFEQDLGKRQEEFTRAMAVPVPEAPVFTDNAKDEPLTEINMIIKRTIAERNLELEQIHKSANKADAEKWLKSAPTSLKDEKAVQKTNALKYIKIEKDEIITALPTEELGDILGTAKQITWGTNTMFEDNVSTTPPNDSIFSKLKTMNLPSPQLTTATSVASSTMDIQFLYDYVSKRFDTLEQLMRDSRENPAD
jgi:hypothetical protein